MSVDGVIERRYYVVCGECIDSKEIEYADNESHASEILTDRMGYVRDRRRGWVCPACYALIVSRLAREPRP